MPAGLRLCNSLVHWSLWWCDGLACFLVACQPMVSALPPTPHTALPDQPDVPALHAARYPDVNHGRVGGKAIREVVADNAWLDGEFVATVRSVGRLV